MNQFSVTTAYDLPFEVRYSPRPLLSSGGPVSVVVTSEAESDPQVLPTVLERFGGLSAAGALAGRDIEPWNSGFQLKALRHGTAYDLMSCRVDERALVVLAHLLLARKDELLPQSVVVSLRNEQATETLQHDATKLPDYPGRYGSLPFVLIDEEPESGAYTFTAELREPLGARHCEYLENALKQWTEGILAGAYGLAPIPPQESYVEPEGDQVTSFGTTVEWSVFKLTADPDCINGLINIFSAFHRRCQTVVALTIT